MSNKIEQEDRRKIYEAVGHVITAMPMEQAAQWLKTFSVEILAKIHTVVNRPSSTKQETQDVLGKRTNFLHPISMSLSLATRWIRESRGPPEHCPGLRE